MRKDVHMSESHLSCTAADRVVILGNHRDAWVFGAADPNSGTAALMEIARSFSVLRSYGRICSETL